MLIAILPGKDASDRQIQRFKELLLAGGQINIADDVLTKNIRNAEWLAFAGIADGTLCGIGAVKNPQNSYKRKVFERANKAAHKDMFTHEVGYFVTAAGYEGLRVCSKILEALLERVITYRLNVFATTKSPAMRKALERAGFIKFGDSYVADSENTLDLYTRLF